MYDKDCVSSFDCFLLLKKQTEIYPSQFYLLAKLQFL